MADLSRDDLARKLEEQKAKAAKISAQLIEDKKNPEIEKRKEIVSRQNTSQLIKNLNREVIEQDMFILIESTNGKTYVLEVKMNYQQFLKEIKKDVLFNQFVRNNIVRIQQFRDKKSLDKVVKEIKKSDEEQVSLLKKLLNKAKK